MFCLSWRRWFPWSSGPSRRQRRKQPGGGRFRPAVHVLEDRTAPADLAVMQKGLPAPVAPGTDLTYSIAVINKGPDVALSAQLSEAVPANTTFVSAKEDTGPTSVATTPPVGGTGPIMFSFSSFNPGATASLTIVVHVNPGTPSGSTILGTVSISASTPDSDPTNNMATTMTTVRAAGSLTSTGTIIHAVQGTLRSGVSVASVVDSTGTQPLGNYSVLIDWGDGTPASPGVVTRAGTGLTAHGDHTYTVEGFYSVSVSVTRGGTTTTSRSTASVFGYVTSLYEEVLGREPDVAGLGYWVALQQAGLPRPVIANYFWASAEHVGVEVDQLYATLFGRAADAAGRAYWVQRVASGTNFTDVAIAFLTVPEYTATHFVDVAYVNGLFNNVLGRPADSSILSWVQLMRSGALSRAALATVFLTSDEAYVDALSDYYREFLGRPLDPFAFQLWMSPAVRRQATPLSVTGLVLGSDEYLIHQFALARQRLTA